MDSVLEAAQSFDIRSAIWISCCTQTHALGIGTPRHTRAPPPSAQCPRRTAARRQVGGILASETFSAAAASSLMAAMTGLAVLWIGVSWLLLAAGCQLSHTESEALLCSGVTCAAAAQVGEPANQAAVQRLSSWIARGLAGGGGGGGQRASREPLLEDEGGRRP